MTTEERREITLYTVHGSLYAVHSTARKRCVIQKLLTKPSIITREIMMGLLNKRPLLYSLLLIVNLRESEGQRVDSGRSL